MAYSFYLDGMLLPITPESLQIKIRNKNKTIVLLNEGEINFLKLPGLSEISFDLLLPHTTYPFLSGSAETMDFYLSKLERLKTGKNHFQFIVSRVTAGGKLLFDTNMKVSLEEYEIQEDVLNLGQDVKVSIRLKQYRVYGTKTIQIEQPKQAGELPQASVSQQRDATSAPQPKTYTVQKGDCLWNIAKKQLGDGAKYTEIAALNQDKIVNPNLIYPGQVLTLP